jgi:hypothetical protein
MGEIVDLRSGVLIAQLPGRLDPVVAGRVEDHENRITQASPSCTSEALERAAFAGIVSADILDGRNAGHEQRLVRRIPLGKVLDRLAPGRLPVFRRRI